MGVLSLGSCTSVAPVSEERAAANRTLAAHESVFHQDRYLRDIQPIFNQRCLICHACAEAPCQLHFDSYSNVRRGATPVELIDLMASAPTRPKDARTLQEWRLKGFSPILFEDLTRTEERNKLSPEELALLTAKRISSAEENLNQSLLYRFIQHGYLYNGPGFSLEALDSHREEGNQCISSPDQFNAFIKKHPAAGMPYGMPALPPQEFSTLRKWIEDGAPGPSPEARSLLQNATRPDVLEEWEKLFNGSPKARLIGRFVYEHVFSSMIHFEGTPQDEFFELVRSRTPFPEPVSEIVTPRPNDSPFDSASDRGKLGLHYRFKKVDRATVRKTHVLWELGPAKLLSLQRLFLEPQWPAEKKGKLVESNYSSRNPFGYFQQIPAEIRYRFMLENSHVIADAMVRGPVCSSQAAADAIRDHFWVFFLEPSADVTVVDPAIGQKSWAPLGSLLSTLMKRRISPYSAAVRRLRPKGFSIQDIWNGEGTNPNAMLTIMRHRSSVSVHRGAHGGQPDTVWVLNYANFERIYYNLVVEFMPWENRLHQLGTWNAMSAHRAEAEERFLSFLPEVQRNEIRSEWTRGLGAYENPLQRKLSEGIPSQIEVKADAPVSDLLKQLIARVPQSVEVAKDSLAAYPPNDTFLPPQIRSIEEWEEGLKAVSANGIAPYAQYLPDIFFIWIEDRAYSVIAHRVYSYQNIVEVMNLAREPEKDALAAFRGLYGNKPEMFFELNLSQAVEFLRELQLIRSEAMWKVFRAKYGIRRNDARVWTLLDRFTEWDHRTHPLEAGAFDMSEYDFN